MPHLSPHPLNQARLRRATLCATFSAALFTVLASSAALAQPAPGAAPASRPAAPPPQAACTCANERPDPVAQAQDRLARLKSELKLSASQEKAWQGFSASALKQAETMKTRQAQAPKDPQADAKLHAPERMAQHLEQDKLRLADMESMNKSVKELYAALTPEQQTQADRHFERLAREMGPGPGGRGPGPDERHGHGDRRDDGRRGDGHGDDRRDDDRRDERGPRG